MKYEPVIGLEIHAELKTKTKMFCFSLNDPDEKHPNINICPVCMGHPGTLPVINEEAVRKVILVGLALNGEIPEFSQFDRKNYFYPDLPKGYQISQYKYPLVKGGFLELQNSKKMALTRIHLEEDTGRLIHPVRSQTPKASAVPLEAERTSNGVYDKESGASLVDFNRAGVPLMELVTEPDLRSGEEVREFGEKLQQILRYLGASDANMEKGEMRVEVNISLREVGSEELGTKVEIKNINSFKYAADAVEYEIKRQTGILEKGEKVIQETRGWNENTQETFSQRSKEGAHDYRYFPEPDLPPLTISREFVAELAAQLPELPDAKKKRFMESFGLDEQVVKILVREKDFADYFEAAASELQQHDKAARYASEHRQNDVSSGRETPGTQKKNLIPLLASWMTGDFVRMLRNASAGIRDVRVTPERFAELVLYVAEDKISNLAAKEVLEEMIHSGENPVAIIEKRGLWQISDSSDLEDIVRHMMEENPKAVEDYRSGKAASIQFLVGQVMKDSQGKANPKIVQEIIKKLLDSRQ